jgi:hypothetical protein
LLCDTACYAQQDHRQDVVYLHKGSTTKGIIIEQVPNKSLKIETKNGDVFSYSFDEISKITKEKVLPSLQQPQQGQEQQQAISDPKGYFGTLEAAYSIGIGRLGINRYCLTYIVGYQFNPYIIFGGGIGIHHYKEQEISLPVTAYFRANLIDARTVPYFAINLGYNINLTSYGARGLVLEPTFGVAFNANSANTITLGVGYSLNQYRAPNFNGLSSAISVKIGSTF